MRFFIILTVLAVFVGAIWATPVLAQKEVFVYRGATLAQSGITVGSWGSGKANESKEKVLAGAQSIKIVTQGLYSGGRIDFAQPVALFSGGIDTKKYVVFSFFFNDTQTIDLAASTGYWYDVEPYTIPTATRVRFVFESDTGVTVAVEQPTGPIDPDDNWLRIAVPLAKFSAAGDVKEFRLKRLVIGTDAPGTAAAPATLFLGEIKVVEDTEPIKVGSLGEQTVVIGDEVLFVAEATGGVSSLKYSWDWDAKNGIQEETTGTVGRVTYYKDAEYTVTLTVTDVNGLKAPVSVTGKVTVN